MYVQGGACPPGTYRAPYAPMAAQGAELCTAMDGVFGAMACGDGSWGFKARYYGCVFTTACGGMGDSICCNY